VKTIDLPIVANVVRMSKDVVNLYMEQEVGTPVCLWLLFITVYYLSIGNKLAVNN